jgi:hypothetical protein
MHYRLCQLNSVWTVLFSILAALSLNACSDTNNVSGPAPLSPDAQLSTLTVTPGTLQPAFSGDVADYTVNVLTTVTSVTVTATPQDTNASMKINGQPTPSGQARTITLGGPSSSTPIPIVVTAVSGSQNTYIVTVNRAAPGGNNNLQSLTVSPGALAPAFSASQTSYTVAVATTVASVTVSATKSDPNAVMSGSLTAGAGHATGQATIPLGGAPSSTIVSIIVTAPNGSQNTYIVTVNRAAPGGNNNLQSLTVSPGSLTPAFNANKRTYTVDVASGVASVTVGATPQDAGATVSINDQVTPSLSVPLGAAGSSTLITIEVTAPNGNQKTYLVTVNRAAPTGNNNLQTLTVTPGTLAPVFIASTTNYTVSFASGVGSLTVKAQPQDAGATVSINGQTSTSLSVTLGAPGSSTPISIVVTAPNLSQNTYDVSVNRAAIVLSGNNNLSALAVSAGALVPDFDPATTNYTVTTLIGTDTTVTATVADSTATLTINGSPATSGVESASIPLAQGANSISIVVTAENGTKNPYTVVVTRVL